MLCRLIGVRDNRDDEYAKIDTNVDADDADEELQLQRASLLFVLVRLFVFSLGSSTPFNHGSRDSRHNTGEVQYKL